MSIIGSRVLGGAGQQTYSILNSARFRSSASAYLSRTPSVASNRRTWTWSGWVKRGSLGSVQTVFGASAVSPTNDSNLTGFSFDAGDTFTFGGGATVFITTTQVFRDPSAWYHIVVALDTTQATASNRVKLYVNGVQVTAFSTSNYTTLNLDTAINSAVQHDLASLLPFGGRYFDGYLAEVNFIDGQQLTPTSFGAYDNNGVWQPIKYGGTYGTNGFYLKLNGSSTSSGAITTTSSNWDNYFKRSDNATGWAASTISIAKYPLNYVFNAANFQSGTWFTDFAWQLANEPNANATPQYYYLSFTDGSDIAYVGSGGNTQTIATQTNLSWPNGHAQWDAVNKKLYDTNVYQGSMTERTAYSGKTLNYMALYGGYSGSNGLFAYNNMYQTSVFSFGTDSSGNNNNFTTYNLSYSSGVTYDAMIDSPTLSVGASNYAVVNPLSINKSGSSWLVVTEANLQFASSTGTAYGAGTGSIGFSSGKWYWEVTLLSSNQVVFGVSSIPYYQQGFIGSDAYGWGYISNTGNKANNNVSSAYGASATTNDVIGVAMDADTGTLTFYKNGSSLGTAFSGMALQTYWPAVSNYYSTKQSINFGQRPFSYTPPSGYKALNTYNLPQPTIMNGAKYMQATLYTGNGSATQTIAQSVTGNSATFLPDFVWTKGRSGATNNIQIDTVRGGANYLISDSSSGEAYNAAAAIQSFNSNGYVIGNGGAVNTNAATYVSWQWNAGSGVTSTNTNGTISSLVSVNASAGFSIVSYTGTGANATVGHGLGVAPSMVIVKNRSAAGTNWAVYHASLGASDTQYMLLNTAGAINQAGALALWNNTAPTSTLLSLGTQASTNASTNTYVAYCWSAVAGYSAFGSYTGNGSADGPFIFTGFRPRWLLIKRSSSTADWILHDTSRSPYNLTTTAQTLAPNLSDAEGSVNFANDDFDMLSNGFKMRNIGGAINFNGDTYIYAAFAENPFKVSRAR